MRGPLLRLGEIVHTKPRGGRPDNMQDDLSAARGIANGILIGASMWLVIIYLLT
jgi:hypothetical protein